MEKIFISYSRKDLTFVKKLAFDLQDAGYDVWYDLTDLEGGDRWSVEISNAIKESNAFIVVVSPRSIESDWVEKEFLFASNQHKRIIPILFEACDLPLWLLNIHYINVQGKNYETNFPYILEALKEEPGTKDGKPQAITVIKDKLDARWLAGGLILVALILALVFGLPALLSGPEPTPTTEATQTPERSEPKSTATTVIETDTPIPSPTWTATLAVTPTLAPEVTVGGAEMVLIPSGVFLMGTEDSLSSDEQPVHFVGLVDFYIDKYEVTNAQYKKCLQEAKCEWPENRHLLLDESMAGHPVVNVTWDMAQNFCSWRGTRLPTEAEWEKAAGGGKGNDYPWGGKVSGKMLNFCDLNCTRDNREKGVNDKYTYTAPVGTYPDGASPYGVLDMAGNVWEWTADWYSSRYYRVSPTENPTGPENGQYRVLRGGSWYDLPIGTRIYERYFRNPADRDTSIGFRCAKDATP